MKMPRLEKQTWNCKIVIVAFKVPRNTSHLQLLIILRFWLQWMLKVLMERWNSCIMKD